MDSNDLCSQLLLVYQGSRSGGCTGTTCCRACRDTETWKSGGVAKISIFPMKFVALVPWENLRK